MLKCWARRAALLLLSLALLWGVHLGDAPRLLAPLRQAAASG